MRGTPGQIQPKAIVWDAAFHWWLSSCKTSKILPGPFQLYCWWNKPAIWLANSNAAFPCFPQKVFLRCYLRLRFISMPKIKGIDWFAPEILIIKGSINLIEQEVYLATPIQEYQFQIPSSLDGYVHVKNARYQQIPSRDIDIQKTWLLYLVIRRHTYLVSASLKHDPKLSVKVDDVRKRTDYNNDEGIEESDSLKCQFRLYYVKEV